MGEFMIERKTKTVAEILAGSDRKAAEAKARTAAAEKAKGQAELESNAVVVRKTTMFIRGLDESTHAMPNRIAESSLFAPVARVSQDKQVFHRDAILVSRANTKLTYTGEQLTEEDADIFCHVTALACRSMPGEPVEINRADFLRSIGRDTGKSQYAWLHERIRAFTVATIFYEFTRPDGSPKKSVSRDESLHLVDKYVLNKETGFYNLTIDGRWRELYQNNEYSLWDFSARKSISRGNALAKSLQRLVSTSSDIEQKNSVEFLKARAQYKGRMRDFREALIKAMKEMKRVGIISEWSFRPNQKTGEEMAVWIKAEKVKKNAK